MALSEQQLTDLYYEHADTVYRVCFTYLKGHKADAEDAVQTTFLNLLRKGLPKNIESAKAWLITCGLNNCKNIVTRSHRRDAPLEDCYTRPDERDETLELILRLPRALRLSLYLHYYEGYTAAEIGKALDKSESTVWGYLHKGRNALKKQLMEESYHETRSATSI